MILLILGGILAFALAINEPTAETGISSLTSERTDSSREIFKYLLYLGDGSILMLGAALPAIFGDSEFKHKKGFPFAITTVVGCFLSEILRKIVGVIASNNSGVKSGIGISMPCPAVMNSAVFCFTLAVLIFRYMQNNKLKFFVIALISAVPFVTVVGAYGSNFFDVTDIVAGLCFGAALAVAMSLVTDKGGRVSE